MILLELFWVFLRIGAFTFGGGYAMLPLISEQVLSRGWMESEELVNFIAVSESTPGPFAVNISTYIGTQLAALPGAISATLGVALPSFLIILLIAKCFDAFQHSTAVKGCMSGLRPAVVALIGSTVVSVGKTVFFPQGVTAALFTSAPFYVSVGLFALTTVLAFRKKHPILIIVLSAAVGIVAGYALGL